MVEMLEEVDTEGVPFYVECCRNSKRDATKIGRKLDGTVMNY